MSGLSFSLKFNNCFQINWINYYITGIILTVRNKDKMKNIEFIGSSLEDLSLMPRKIKSIFGDGLWQAQKGDYPRIAKVLSGFGNASVVELKTKSLDGTFRAVYTVQFEDTIYVLHCFKKKSTSGIATPKPDIDLIKRRLKTAMEIENKKGYAR